MSLSIFSFCVYFIDIYPPVLEKLAPLSIHMFTILIFPVHISAFFSFLKKIYGNIILILNAGSFIGHPLKLIDYFVLYTRGAS